MEKTKKLQTMIAIIKLRLLKGAIEISRLLAIALREAEAISCPSSRIEILRSLLKFAVLLFECMYGWMDRIDVIGYARKYNIRRRRE